MLWAEGSGRTPWRAKPDYTYQAAPCAALARGPYEKLDLHRIVDLGDSVTDVPRSSQLWADNRGSRGPSK